MIDGLPWYVPAAILCVNFVFWIFWVVGISRALQRTHAVGRAWIPYAVGAVLIAWLSLQAVLAMRGFYADTTANPPRFLFGIVPPLSAIAIGLTWPRTRAILVAIPLSFLTYVHTVRIAVELVVWALYRHEVTPKIMTFAGINPDIAIGLTAPLIGYFCITKNRWSTRIALAWHILGLTLLTNVAIIFIFSIPGSLQLITGDYPNVGFLYFPFIWAPTHGVPTAIVAHCLAIWVLTRAVSP